MKSLRQNPCRIARESERKDVSRRETEVNAMLTLIAGRRDMRGDGEGEERCGVTWRKQGATVLDDRISWSWNPLIAEYLALSTLLDISLSLSS